MNSTTHSCYTVSPRAPYWASAALPRLQYGSTPLSGVRESPPNLLSKGPALCFRDYDTGQRRLTSHSMIPHVPLEAPSLLAQVHGPPQPPALSPLASASASSSSSYPSLASAAASSSSHLSQVASYSAPSYSALASVYAALYNNSNGTNGSASHASTNNGRTNNGINGNASNAGGSHIHTQHPSRPASHSPSPVAPVPSPSWAASRAGIPLGLCAASP
ncbi:hypothetical protein B0H11DRAFT_2222073 [Mycena galericulata]|nr:hypothetical protein B0H11DRAFT_2222073 [Mycena galericulata]